jgi:hypothetical protein
LIALVAFVRPRKSRLVGVLKYVASLSIIISAISPIDVALFGQPVHCGNSKSGLRLVPLVYGMPMHTRLVAKFGEYYAGGCSMPIWPARWILTWSDASDHHVKQHGAE